MTTQELVIEWSDRLLLLLEEYRAQTPSFKYWLRQVNNEKRLNDGQWFQGNHQYIFIGFYNVGAGANRTRSIGFIVKFNEQNGFVITLDVITEGETDPRTLALYQKIVTSIPGFEKKTDTKYTKNLGNENIEEALLTFLNQLKPTIDSFIKEFGLYDKFDIPDQTFKKALGNVMDFRNRLKTKELNKNFWKYSPGSGAVAWEDNKLKSEMAISDNNSNIGSLLQYASKDELNEKVGLARNAKSNETWNLILFRDAKVGDVILANKGVSSLIGVGIIEDVYQYDANREYQHFRKVKWIADKVWDYTPNYFLGYTTLFRPDTFSPSIPGIQIITAYLKKYPEYTNVFAENGLLPNVETPILNLNNNKKTAMPPLNQILYGPPGTGKTFNTINRALDIIDVSIKGKTRSEIKSLFDAKLKEGQIVFTTFHQSMSYEDFIEGIKPIPPKGEGQHISYEVIGGIFRNIAKKAKENSELASLKKLDSEHIPFDTAFEMLAQKIESGLLEDPVITPNEMTKGFVIQLASSFFSITGINGSSIRMMTRTGNEQNTMTKSTLKSIFENLGDIETYVKGGMKTYYKALVEEMYKWKSDIENLSQNVTARNYVLIIDEINRGNVSQIFGELITLIEDNKRLGNPEALEIMLPYSKEMFGVPSNLYIIGTMNTADRSVEALDTALRRRFSFEEMLPQPELVSPQRKIWELWWKHATVDWKQEPYVSEERDLYGLLGIDTDFDPEELIWKKMKKEGKGEHQVSYFDGVQFSGINLEKVLRAINTRIEVLLDRDHQIGHSYFLSVNSVSQLKDCFKNKIIPLLQEYFYGDYSKIGLVLGSGFVRKKVYDESEFSFAAFDSESSTDFENRDVYEIIDYTMDTISHVIKIKNKDVQMTFEKAIKLLLKQEIE